MNAKEFIRDYCKRKMHFANLNDLDLFQRFATNGLIQSITFDPKELKKRTLEFIKLCHVDDFRYKFAPSSKAPCLYASCYAIMLKGLLEEKLEKCGWIEFFNSYQSSKDGLFYDPELECDEFTTQGKWGDGWGINHLTAHICIAYGRLNDSPKFPFIFLEPFYSLSYLDKWLEKFNFINNLWKQSNYIMNLYSCLQFARDWQNEKRAQLAIDHIGDWLLKHQNPSTGLWHEKKDLNIEESWDAIRAAYHYYPLFVYDRKSIPNVENLSRYIMSLQNSLGAFTFEGRDSGACEDIDACEPMLRFAPSELRNEISISIRKLLVWYLGCWQNDGGFSFYLDNSHQYGGHPLTSSLRHEGSMLGTWFRLLGIGYILDYLGNDNPIHMGHFPGYEISLK